MTRIEIQNRDDITKTIARSKLNGRPLDEFIILSGATKANIRALPREIQKQVESYIGSRNKADIIIRKT